MGLRGGLFRGGLRRGGVPCAVPDDGTGAARGGDRAGDGGRLSAWQMLSTSWHTLSSVLCMSAVRDSSVLTAWPIVRGMSWGASSGRSWSWYMLGSC